MQPREMATVLGRVALFAAAFILGCERDAARESEPNPPPAEASPHTYDTQPGRPGAHEVTWGEPDGPKMRKWMRGRAAEVRRCYETALTGDPAVRGRLTLRFTIAETGALRDVAATRSTFARRDVPACIVDVVRGWRTPFRPAEPVEVEYPFSFSPR